MLYRLTLAAAVAASLCLTGAARAAAPFTFQPEVLLMKTTNNGLRQSFDYAKLKPAVTSGSPAEAVFRYRADIDVVTCTVDATPKSGGAVHVNITLQRSRTLPDGNPELTTKTSQYDLAPGKPFIVDTSPRVLMNGIDGVVQILQLTLAK